METADMVKVAVSAAPYSIDKPYSYLVPESLAAAAVPGVRVMVPFGRGNKESEGLILARVQEPKLPGSKALRQILDSEPVLDKAGRIPTEAEDDWMMTVTTMPTSTPSMGLVMVTNSS